MSDVNETHGEIVKFLQSGGSYASALEWLVKDEDRRKHVARIKDTVAMRKGVLREALASSDPEVLVPLQAKMQEYVDAVAKVEMDEPRKLTDGEAFALMREFVDRREIDEFLSTRRDAIKDIVFTAIDFELQEKGLDPEVTGGELAVPELGKVFKKEGCRRGEPALDEKKLRKLLGPRVEKVYRTETVPAHTVEVLDEQELMRLAQEDPEVMEIIRSSLTPGKPSSPRFVVRDLKEEER